MYVSVADLKQKSNPNKAFSIMYAYGKTFLFLKCKIFAVLNRLQLLLCSILKRFQREADRRDCDMPLKNKYRMSKLTQQWKHDYVVNVSNTKIEVKAYMSQSGFFNLGYHFSSYC